MALPKDMKPVDAGKSSDMLSADETALFVERMCVELRTMSARSGFDFLAYLLDIAREEASLNLFRNTKG